MIPNYFSKWLYMEGIKEWHRLNLGQIVTGRLSSNANPDPDQVTMQQSLIHKVMQQDVAMGQVLSKEEHIEALEHELFALRQLSEMFNGVKVPHMAYQPANNTPKVTPLISNTSVTNSPSNSALVPAAKPADKGKTPERFITNKQLPIAKEPVAQPPVHLFSSISSCYALPANRNFAAPNRFNEGTYQTMPPIYNIEQPKAVFEWVLSTKVMVSVDKLCLVSEDIRNQFRTAITPRQLVGASANTVQDTRSNAATTNRLTLDKAQLASVNSIETYIDLLPLGEEPVVLTVAKDSQSLQSIMMLIDNHKEIECITDSGSQIISMSAKIANDLDLSYDPIIILNMQSANGTMD
ncbi:hypothetical protein J132_06812 [Termitomyces sp. J132]|nr:hypothetical protein J132_06812 [Termitomyces sp. J132]